MSRVVLKVSRGDDVRRIALKADEVHYQDVLDRVRSAFQLQQVAFSLKYFDEEKELVTVSCDQELVEAISHLHQITRLTNSRFYVVQPGQRSDDILASTMCQSVTRSVLGPYPPVTTYSDYPYLGTHPGTTNPGSPYPSTAYPGSPYPSTAYPGSPYPSTAYPGSPYPSTAYPGSPYPSTAYPGSPFAGSTHASTMYPNSGSFNGSPHPEPSHLGSIPDSSSVTHIGEGSAPLESAYISSFLQMGIQDPRTVSQVPPQPQEPHSSPFQLSDLSASRGTDQLSSGDQSAIEVSNASVPSSDSKPIQMKKEPMEDEHTSSLNLKADQDSAPPAAQPAFSFGTGPLPVQPEIQEEPPAQSGPSFFSFGTGEPPVQPEAQVVHYEGKEMESGSPANESELPANKEFNKSWVVMNTGDVPWPEGTRLVVGDEIGLEAMISPLAPGAQARVGITFPASAAAAGQLSWKQCMIISEDDTLILPLSPIVINFAAEDISPSPRRDEFSKNEPAQDPYYPMDSWGEAHGYHQPPPSNEKFEEPPKPFDHLLEQNVAALENLGFSSSRCRATLERCGNNLDQAIDFLLSEE